MAKYELVVIFDPFLTDEQHTEQVERVREQVVRRGGEVLNVDVWGKKRLAYPIAKKQEGFYAVVLFQGTLDSASLSEIERSMRLNESCLREMVTRLPEEKPNRKPVKVRKPKPAAVPVDNYRGDERRSFVETRSAGDAGAAAAGLGPNAE
jgi:small subunit ribosomal protein S6